MPVGPSCAGGASLGYSPVLSPVLVAADKLALQPQGVPSAAEDSGGGRDLPSSAAAGAGAGA